MKKLQKDNKISIEAEKEYIELQLRQLDKMPLMIHDMIKENWELKKEIFNLQKEKANYHKNMNEIESYINDEKQILSKYTQLTNAIEKIHHTKMRNNPLKKIKAFKEMMKLYNKVK